VKIEIDVIERIRFPTHITNESVHVRLKKVHISPREHAEAARVENHSHDRSRPMIVVRNSSDETIQSHPGHGGDAEEEREKEFYGIPDAVKWGEMMQQLIEWRTSP